MINKGFNYRTWVPYILVILVFAILSLIYCAPVIEGKQINQSDIKNYKGAAKEIEDFRVETGEEALWTNSMFSGMPAFQTSVLYKNNISSFFEKGIRLWLPHPVNLVFVLMLGFFILLLVLGFDIWLSMAGAIAFAFSSYFFIFIEAGHNTKVMAIGYMAPVVAGVLLAFRGRYLWGGILAAVFLGLEIKANHLQITYYLLMLILILGLVELIFLVREKKLMQFFKAVGVLLMAAFIAIGVNFSLLWTTYESSKYTTRGKSELTLDLANKTSGLDKDYATAWSYGTGETMTLLIPNFYGGASDGELSTNSNTYEALVQNNVPVGQARNIIKHLPLYWGDQPFTSGPVYVGAIVFFLFVLALFVVKGRYKWWLLGAIVLSIMLAWGKNFMTLSGFFLDYVPGYNKFRAVSTILIVTEFCMPLLAFLGLREIFRGELKKEVVVKYLKYSLYIAGGLCLLFIVAGGAFFDFVGAQDGQMANAGYPEWLMQAIRDDRARMLRSDAFRSLVFVLLAAVVIWAVIKEKMKKQYAYLAFIILILIDLWGVDKRYLNSDDFVRKTLVINPYKPTSADQMILQDKDPNFRVLNTAVNTFNDASTSYFHKSIGGYHGAKLGRYQELIEHQISKNNMDVFNMLNTKYFIVQGEGGAPMAQFNPDALGNAWFVEKYKLVENADSEIMALSDFDPAITVIIDKRYKGQLENYRNPKDTLATIALKEYKPNNLIYEYSASMEQLAVFSEIFYDKGWDAYVDGEPAPYFRVNYVLRAMIVPSGTHTIEFKFKPKSYYLGEKISFSFSALLALLIIGALGVEAKRFIRRKEK